MADASFIETRNALHHAAQVVSAWGATHRAPDPDHQYANLGWDARLDALVGRRAHGLAAGIRLRGATWFLARGSEILAERGVKGSTMAEALAWLRDAGRAAGGPATDLAPVGYDLPPHPVADGQPFPGLDPAALARLADWYGVADAALSRIAAIEPHAQEVRCWPHHFDLGTLVEIDVNPPDPETARAIGLGMTPGDDSVAEPYFYVNPYPSPSADQLPALAHGTWHTEGWLGALLTGSAWDGDAASLDAFLTEAVRVARQLLRA